MTNETQAHVVHPEDLTLYVLGALEGPELVRIGKHVEGCASCRLEVKRINADLGAYASAASPQAAPPAPAKNRLMEAIGREEHPVTKRAGWNWSWVFRTSVASILLIAAIVEWRDARSVRNQNAQLAKQLTQAQAESAQARAIAETIKAPDAIRLTLLEGGGKPQPMAHAIYSPQKARVLLMAHNLDPLPPGKIYELWLLPMSGAPVPAGMFKSDAHGNAQMLHGGLPSGMIAKGFAISIEPEQGSLAPSESPILIGTGS